MALFPEAMKSSGTMMTLEGIASKLTHFENQLHLLHWQTLSHAEHTALGLYDDVHDFKDDVIEKLMGYMGKRPKAFKFEPIADTATSEQVVTALKDWAYELYEWAGENHYCDVENMAQDLSGKAAKTLYLLTQS